MASLDSSATRGARRAAIAGFVGLGGAVALLLVSGASAVDPALSVSMMPRWQALASIWARPADKPTSTAGLTADGLHLTKLSGSRTLGAGAGTWQESGDETYWLSNRDGAASNPGPIAIGTRMNFALSPMTAAASTRTFEIIEMKSLSEVAATPATVSGSGSVVAPAQSGSRGLTLVVCREVLPATDGDGAPAHVIRFLIESDQSSVPGGIPVLGPKSL